MEMDMKKIGSLEESTMTAEARSKWRILWSVIVGLFMVVLDSTVMNVALKALQSHFVATTDQVQWVISVYTLVLGISTPLSGYLADRFGSKRIYLGALAFFAFGSLLAGLAASQGSLVFLILARGVQGIGGGIALPLGMAMMFRAFPPGQRGTASGIFSVVMVFAPALGPLIGGWLVDHQLISWIFLVNLPIGVLGLMVGSVFLVGDKGSKEVRADVPGMLSAAVGFGLILSSTSVAGQQGMGWTHPEVLLLLGAGLLTLCVFIIIELRSPVPLMDLRLYAIPSFALANVASVVGTISLFGAEFLLPLYLQILRGETALNAGLLLLPMAATAMIVSPLAGRFADTVGPRIPLVVGFLLIAFNTYQLAHLELKTSLIFIMVLVALRGIAVGLIIQNAQLASLLDVPARRLTRATPLLNATRQTMLSIGVAILATILTSTMTTTVPAAIATGNAPDVSTLPPVARAFAQQAYHTFQSQYIAGLDHAYLVTFVIAVVVAFLCLFLPGWPGKYNPAARQKAANAVPALDAPELTEVVA